MLFKKRRCSKNHIEPQSYQGFQTHAVRMSTLNLTKQQLLGFDTLIFFCQNAMESNRYPSIYIDINALTGILKTNYIQNVEEKGEG